MSRILFIIAVLVLVAWAAACGWSGQIVVNGAVLLAAFLAFGAWAFSLKEDRS